ncbi:hypothetical protein N0V90_000703 [Kalmusia sp. IMI 367209]|nr:hypothetical protein N0V90_000703 [Kalmusia sp. IMI 367209]
MSQTGNDVNYPSCMYASISTELARPSIDDEPIIEELAANEVANMNFSDERISCAPELSNVFHPNDDEVHRSICQDSNASPMLSDSPVDTFKCFTIYRGSQGVRFDTNHFDADDHEFDSRAYDDLQQAAGIFSHDISKPPSTIHGGFQRGRVATAAPVSAMNTLYSRISTLVSRYRQPTRSYPNSYDTFRSLSSSLSEEEESEEDRLRREENLRDLIDELQDDDAMSPTNIDQHDKIIANFFVDVYAALPYDAAPRKMHVLDWPSLNNVHDDLHIILQHVKPRLCDAVATVLFESDPMVLDAFLNPEKKMVEWWNRTAACSRRSNIVIRRNGKEVLVATFRNQGFKLIWGHYVKCEIDADGVWSEVFGMSGFASSDVKDGEVDWDSFERLNPQRDDVDELLDPQNALVAGRKFGKALLLAQPWDTLRNRTNTEWICDGETKVLSVRGRRGV